MSPKTFGMRLKELRNKKGWSQATLAAKLGVTREYLARLEGGQHASESLHPSVQSLMDDLDYQI